MVVEDVGTVLNPDLVEGRVMVALPKALVRRLARFCAMTITGSYYQDRLWITVPIAGDLPSSVFQRLPYRPRSIRLGQRLGEAGTVGSCSYYECSDGRVVDGQGGAFEMRPRRTASGKL